MAQQLHGASSYCGMDISTEGDIAVITGDCVRHLSWNDKNMEMIYSSNRLSNEVDIETIAPTLQTFRAPEVLCVKFSPATVSPNGRPLLAATTSFGEVYVLRAPQLGVSSCWILHCDLTSAILDHLIAQPELEQVLNAAEPPSQFILADRDAASAEADAALQQRLQEQEIFDDAKRKAEALERLTRKLAEAEATYKYAAAMKAIDSNGGSDAQRCKDAEEAAAAAAEAARAVAAATEAAESALALTRMLASKQSSAADSHALRPNVDVQRSETQNASQASAALDNADADLLSGAKRVRSDNGDNVSSTGTGTPRTPSTYVTKTPGYISKFAMDSRVPGASDQLARIIKSMQKLFIAERSKLPVHLQISYGSWNKFSEQDQNLMSSVFDRVYAAEEECIRTFQLEDVCTTKRLQQHVRIALRKVEEGAITGEVADEVERNLYNESTQQAANTPGSSATPSASNPAFTPGARTGASHENHVQSMKKQYVVTPKTVDDRAAAKTHGMGGKKHPFGHTLAMQCRSMCVYPVILDCLCLEHGCVFFLGNSHVLHVLDIAHHQECRHQVSASKCQRCCASFFFIHRPATYDSCSAV